MASTTRAALRQAIDVRLRLVHGAPDVTRTATSGSTSTVVDTAAVEADNYWNQYWLYVSDTTDDLAPKDEEARVSAYTARTHTFTMAPALTAAVGTGDTYELRRYFPASSIHDAIDHAIESARQDFPNLTIDETVVIQEDVDDYTLPTTIDSVYKIEVMEHAIDYMGTATSGAASTLTDTSQSWGTNDLADMELVVYSGTGAGQYRTIQSNTSTAITISPVWATNPDSTSKYMVKDVVNDPPTISRVQRYDVIGGKVYFGCALPEGQRLRITHQPMHTTLATDASTTTVPKTYIVLKATMELILMSPLTAPDEAWSKRALGVHDRLETELMRFLEKNKRPAPYTTFLNRGGTKRRRWYSTGELAIGSREDS